MLTLILFLKKVSVFDIPEQKIQDFEKLKWDKITSLIKVERSGTRGKKDYEHLAYYSLYQKDEVCQIL